MEYIWELSLKDGTKVEIPPTHVEAVQQRLNDGKPILTSGASIPANFVSIFRKTSKQTNKQQLIEDVARAFGSAELNEDGSVVCRWVKREVSADRYQKYYAPLRYQKLNETSGVVTIAMFLPVHIIDPNELQNCTNSEVKELERYRNKHS